jgi:pyruvate dehydrogenase E2 component (dihydrolipoamide acetyltransferase)
MQWWQRFAADAVRPSPPDQEDVRLPLSRNRRAIASLMARSASIPQFGIDAHIDVTRIVAHREREQTFSIGDAVLRATALALRAHPELNASFDEDAIVRHAQVNLGLGIIGPEGLMVVVVRDADRLTLGELATERRRLADAAREGELRGEEVIGATFVVSNLGPAGVVRFQALLVPPAAAILAVGSVQDRLRPADTGVERFAALTVCLTCDHRVVDGLDAARFLQTLTELLERPEQLAAA